jgi:pimeloyl-ACP methyl ester carboxylesterase
MPGEDTVRRVENQFRPPVLASSDLRSTLHEGELDGLPVRWLRAPGDDPPILWVHGVPNSADLWRPFLERAGGIAVDLPGFGRSGKPADGDYSAAGFAAFLERFLAWQGIERVRVVAHDWGAPALLLGDRIERAVAIDVVPLLAGYDWHWVARLWRRRGIGELTMAMTSRMSLRRLGRVPPELIDDVMRHFDHGTQRAILRLYRGADPGVLADAGERLRDLRCPVLVLWGEDDGYIEPGWAARLAAALPDAHARVIPGAGHWPWTDRPELVDEVVAFLAAAGRTPSR